MDQWFKGTFGYWLANPKEPVLVDMGNVSQLLELSKKGHQVCGFDVAKVNQDKVAALFKMREVDNPMGKQFA
uniref:Uncharacterized protein n=1 Tax=Romanomermis culicivorax TaxID=13658 RepID=A0A915IPH9_ROMCU